MELPVLKEQHARKGTPPLITLANICAFTVPQALVNAYYAIFSFNSHKVFTYNIYNDTQEISKTKG